MVKVEVEDPVEVGLEEHPLLILEQQELLIQVEAVAVEDILEDYR
jgi:hypothetical protein